MKWTKLKLENRKELEAYISKESPETSDLNFTNIWMWDHLRDTHFAFVEDFLCFKISDGEEKLLMPIGKGDYFLLIKTLKEDFYSRKKKLIIRAIKHEKVEEIRKAFIEPYECIIENNRFDYVYSYDSLVDLKGNKYQGKRNLVYQFYKAFGHQYTDIKEDLYPLVVKMEQQWFENNPNKSEFLYNEHLGILRLLTNFNYLNIKGGALIVNGNVVAFSIAEQISSKMLLIHVEKALHSYKGAYQTMSQDLLRHFSPDIMYVNKEEDLGLPGLMQAKRSYHPIMMIKKYCLKEL